MAVINLTPHSVEVYAESQFTNLEQLNPTTWVADGVEGEPLATYESQGVARISTSVEEEGTLAQHGLGFSLVKDANIPLVSTTYGKATGIPDYVNEDHVLIVSLPMKSMAMSSRNRFANQMVSPYKVVRSRENGSLVLGCMGFTY